MWDMVGSIPTVRPWRSLRRLRCDVRKWNSWDSFDIQVWSNSPLWFSRSHASQTHLLPQFSGVSTRHSTPSIQLARFTTGQRWRISSTYHGISCRTSRGGMQGGESGIWWCPHFGSLLEKNSFGFGEKIDIITFDGTSVPDSATDSAVQTVFA